MGDTPSTGLIHLADDEGNSVRVDVLGVDPRWAGGLDAEIVVGTPFVSGRLRLGLSRSRLERWGEALERLGGGVDAGWMEMDRGPSVFVRLDGERGCPEVVVEDESGSMVTVCVPVVPPDDWIADHRRRLHQVMEYWAPLMAR
ncbi:DUF5959 family protein [Streptomyces murinus]